MVKNGEGKKKLNLGRSESDEDNTNIMFREISQQGLNLM